MNVCVALEHRFQRLPDGSVWSRTQFDRSFWQRYLDVFDGVRCLARVRDIDQLTGEWQRADGDGVSFQAVPYYVGPLEFVKRARAVRATVHRSIRPGDAVVLRVPGNISTIAWRRLRALGHPYGVEVVTDPYDVFSPGSVVHPLRRLLRWHTPRRLRRQCAAASAASYVTDSTLQRRYPSPAPTVTASSIDLPDAAFRATSRHYNTAGLRLIFVGSLATQRKGLDVLIRAIGRIVSKGLDVRLIVVGDGWCRPECEQLAARLGCDDRVHFAGELPAGERVRAELDNADMFVLPSRSEGLPRAMIEAMARGLPCIGSTAGGIPELLPTGDLVPPGDADALAAKLREVLLDPRRLDRMSMRNLERASVYRSARLQAKRALFYRALRDATERWSSAGAVAVTSV